MAKYKNKIITALIIATVLAFVFHYGGDAPELRALPRESGVMNVQESEAVTEAPAPDEKADEKESEPQEPKAQDISKEQAMVTHKAADNDQHSAEPEPVEPENAAVTDAALTCTLSVRCDTILDNLEWLDAEKLGIVPDDGVIFAPKAVTFYDGESVFDLLLREMKESKIHLEFENTPIYKSAYIEGIGNLYEFDCGELSGWMYKVNGIFPSYGCSRYQLKAGDRVEWVYTCDLGADVGGKFVSRGNRYE